MSSRHRGAGRASRLACALSAAVQHAGNAAILDRPPSTYASSREDRLVVDVTNFETCALRTVPLPRRTHPQPQLAETA